MTSSTLEAIAKPCLEISVLISYKAIFLCFEKHMKCVIEEVKSLEILKSHSLKPWIVLMFHWVNQV